MYSKDTKRCEEGSGVRRASLPKIVTSIRTPGKITRSLGGRFVARHVIFASLGKRSCLIKCRSAVIDNRSSQRS